MPNTLPVNVHKLDGTFRKDRHGDIQENGKLVLAEGYPEIPEFMYYAPYACDVWARIKAIMEPSNIYTAAETNLLARYCIMQAEYELSIINGRVARPKRKEPKKNINPFSDEWYDEAEESEEGHQVGYFTANRLNILRSLERDLYLCPEMRFKIGNKKKEKEKTGFEKFKQGK